MEISNNNKEFLEKLEKADIVSYKIYNDFGLAEINTKDNTFIMNLKTFDLYLDRLVKITNK